MAKLVSGTYGEALFELAVEQSKTDVFMEEIHVILQILEENPEFSKLMNHPKIDKEEKVKIIETVFKGKIDAALVGFLRLLVIKDRYAQVDEILAYFIDAVKAEKKIGVAYVTSANALTEMQQQQIEQRLLDTTEYQKMEMNYSIDASIIGGLVIRIGDRVVDSSIATKLNELKKQLMKIQLA